MLNILSCSLFAIYTSLMKCGFRSFTIKKKLGFLIIELLEFYSGLKFFILFCEEKEYICQF